MFVLLACISLAMTCFQPHCYANANAMKASDGDTIEKNPSYVVEEEDDSSDDSSDDDDDIDDDESEDEEDTVPSKKATKSILSKALVKPKKMAKLAKKHKTKIVILLVVFAFRKEIRRVLFKFISVPVYDDQNKQVGRSLTINPTSILKLLFFIQFMWRSFGGSSGSTSSLMPPDAAAVLFPRMKSASVYLPPTEQHWTFERMNERYDKDGLALEKAIGQSTTAAASTTTTVSTNNSTAPSAPLSLAGLFREVLHSAASSSTTKEQQHNGTVIVMDLTKLSTTVVQMELIRDQVSFLLSQHKANQTRCAAASNNVTASNDNNSTTVIVSEEAELEIVILLESPGGGAADYGLAAQQLMRLRNQAGIKLTVCVDKVAASGGYMMAATGHEILAAPFAVVGSIGVYGQTINVHDLLEGWGVKDLIFRAGKNKAPLGLIGEVTKEGRSTIQSMIDATHVAFKYHIATVRPILRDVIDEVATGDIWLGYHALDRGLVDRLVTSDEYIGERMEQGAKVLKLIRYRKPSFMFGPRASSEYSVSALVRSVAAQLKQALVGSVEESESINARSLSAHLVQTKSPIS
jgi:signal peptide peptidase SppA